MIKNEGEYIIISHFDLEVVKEFSNKDVQQFKIDHPEMVTTYNQMLNPLDKVNKFRDWNYLKPPENIKSGTVEFVRNKKYLLTEKGKAAKEEYEAKIKHQQQVSELQFNKLQNEVLDLQNRLNNFKPSNRRANWAILISIIAAILTALKLMQK